ncbi:lipopolysaccharide biosynthesis protein [Alkalibacterium kapii]|uniref:Succinoglycan biosynthesis transport protein ExoT n=1 Tax=Alkalibacterium kapii TaxID=426704 RepID=A0A511AS76_9LACT|nr:lipopolysaccharide biosynthesis protein [Alkalibacterium kapii]GEK91054.1 succinoglycan biosynthesis transport protein ExoT [Alkalibacterium kapii]
MSKLKNQAVNSIKWTTIKTVINSLAAPLLLIFKARYLSPTEFGVMAIINVFVSLISVFENFGVSTAIIQKDEITKNERSSLFVFQTAFSVIIGILIIVFSPVMSAIYDMDALTSLLPILSLSVFFNAPVILFTAFLEKELHFKALSIIQIIREAVLVIATVIFLMMDFGLLGVVLGQVASVAVMAILVMIESYRADLLHLYWHFKLNEIRPFIKFGIYIVAKQLMTQITHHIDELIIGYFLSAEILGLYHFAKNMLGKLRILITTSFAKVMFPVLSKVKNDMSRLTNAYNKISKYLGIFAFPIFIGIAMTAHSFIPVLFGSEWIESTDFFIILSLSYIPYILTANLATSLLYSVNKPNLVLYTDIIVNSVYILILLVFSWMGLGIYSVVILYAVYLVIKTMTLQYLTTMYLHSTFRSYLALFKNTVIASVLMVLVVAGVRYLSTGNVSNLVELILSVIGGGLAYMVTYYLIDKKTLISMKDLALNR